MASPLHFLLPLLVAAVAPDGWLGIYLDQGRPEAVVVEVIPESPAAKAGLQVGDVIVRIGDTGPVARERLRVALAGAPLTQGAGEQSEALYLPLYDRYNWAPRDSGSCHYQ